MGEGGGEKGGGGRGGGGGGEKGGGGEGGGGGERGGENVVERLMKTLQFTACAGVRHLCTHYYSVYKHGHTCHQR